MSSIGDNIRTIRKSQHLTLKEVASKCCEYNLVISENHLSMWETGKRRIYADQLEILCKVFNVTPIQLFPSFETCINRSIMHKYMNLPNDEKEIFRYCAYKWNGNPKALIKFMGLYMSLSTDVRKDLAEYGIWLYERAIKEGKILDDAPFIDYEYIIKEASKIGK